MRTNAKRQDKTSSPIYGCEARKITKTEEEKWTAFYMCLRKILRIWWPQRISNKTISETSGVAKISEEIRRRRWNWIGHILRKERNNDCMVAMGWQPEGKRKIGRPKTTWRRTAEQERRSAGWTSWANARRTAEDRTAWRLRVAALCASWHGEH
ncbi:hypothetical protein BaRGS_00018906 [Batillaria attramentaria]|uniref:Uncharacterized protein n=1 Tax=Batillaria attramentaria TaxID=370345 RepID=A0ABD0KRQ2_9CAEN